MRRLRSTDLDARPRCGTIRGVERAGEALKTQAEAIARRAVELAGETMPRPAERRGLWEDDADFLVQALVGSVVAGDPSIFGDYAVWCADLLGRAGVPAETLAALFEATGGAIAELVP